MNLIICGLPTSGKTHFGQKLARHLGWLFIDTDHLIEAAYKESTGQTLTCRELARKEGDPVFRDWERKIVCQLAQKKQTVIATGGGTFLCSENTKHLKSIGVIIYLQVPLSLALERVNKEKEVRSYLDSANIDQSFLEVIKPRLMSYETSADHIITVDGLEDHQIIELIASKIVGDYHGKQ